MLKLKNDGATTLTADINSTVTSIPVVDGSVFPTLAEGDWFPLTLIKNSNVERMRVIARDGNTLTVTRGVEGTSAQSWVSGDNCTCNLTAEAIAEIMLECDASAQVVESMKNTVEAARDTAVAQATNALNNANAAATSKVDAETAASTATTKASEAEGSAAEALSYKNQAAQISGLETVKDAVDLALANVPFNAMSEVAWKAMQAQNNERYAASGFVHTGRAKLRPSIGCNVINQGMWTTETIPNEIRLGRIITEAYTYGNSKTGFPVLNIAGIKTNLLDLNSTSNAEDNVVKFAAAPNGTVTYDSATGVITDLTKDVDPKYGDVAADTNEAVARAFEGSAPNGDFRFGDDGNWTASDLIPDLEFTFSEAGLRFYTTGSDTGITLEHYKILPALSGSIVIEFDATFDVGTSGIVQVRSAATTWTNIYFYEGYNKIEIADYVNADRIYIRGIHGGAEEIGVTISNFSIRSATNEVVTERVDMPGLQARLVQITEANPFVYPNGLPQSKALTMNGIATTTSSRPVTYYAVFDGDTDSQGLGVNYFAASAENKAKMEADTKNKIVIKSDGTIWQWQVTQETKFYGNGNFKNTDSTKGDLAFDDATPVLSRNGLPFVQSEYKGVFEDGAGNYFLVLPTVPRLNQGACVQGLNEGLGSALCSDSLPWQSSSNKPTILKDCFINQVGGAIGTSSGRLDGRFHNAIYPSGQGGVIDRRLSAHDASSTEQASVVKQSVITGKYRGLEKLSKTKIFELGTLQFDYGFVGTDVYTTYMYAYDYIDNPRNTSIAIALQSLGFNGGYPVSDLSMEASTGQYFINLKDKIKVYMTCVNQTRTETLHYKFEAASQNTAKLIPIGLQAAPTLGEDYEVYFTITVNDFGSRPEYYPNYGEDFVTNISVSGEFTQTDVFGNPVNILQVGALKDGWIGSFNGVIPDSNTKHPLCRKLISGNVALLYSVTAGASWSLTTHPYDSTKNEINAITEGNVCLAQYTAFAKQTEVSVNLQPLHGNASLIDIFTTQDNELATFTESVANTITVSDATGIISESSSAIKLLINSEIERIKTERTDLVAPTNSSQAVKVAVYQIEENCQLFLGFVANTMTHNGTNWGELEEMQLTAGTFQDTNGLPQTSTITKTILPYGWVRNKV